MIVLPSIVNWYVTKAERKLQWKQDKFQQNCVEILCEKHKFRDKIYTFHQNNLKINYELIICNAMNWKQVAEIKNYKISRIQHGKILGAKFLLVHYQE